MTARMQMHGLAALALTLALTASASAAQVGSSVEVAPQAQGTHSQLLASAAWCEGAKMWLVAWREGYLCEDSSDIWCARVSADGKALDPAGIRLTDGPGLKSRPAVASDGKGFLVVWEDFRNGKDWDVYAAQVSADGKPAGKNGFLVAGGEHNQTRPVVTFAKGNYLVAWMGFTKSYGIYGTRVSGDGRLQDNAPLAMAMPGAANQHVITPALGSNGDSAIMAMAPIGTRYCGSYLAASAVDVGGGKLTSPPAPVMGAAMPGPVLTGEDVRSPVVAVGKGEALVASLTYDRARPQLAVCRADLAGKLSAPAVVSGSRSDRQGLAFDGSTYLLVADCVPGGRGVAPKSTIKGWVVAPDGKPGAEFTVSEGSAANCLSPAAAAGPTGACLVVYSEARGADDTKVLARIVK